MGPFTEACAIRMTVSVRLVMNSKADVSISEGFISLKYAKGLRVRFREAYSALIAASCAASIWFSKFSTICSVRMGVVIGAMLYSDSCLSWTFAESE